MEEGAAVATGGGLGARAVDLLQQLLRIDTANPPGNEGPAQELLAETLRDAGFDVELLAAEPGRPNLVARLAGESPGPTLCLLGHADTVPADPSEWSFDPWSGEIADGEIRGRGAQDMKDQVAAEVAAAATLADDGWRPRAGELLVVTTADEETGAALGAQWLCREHPDKVRADYVLNEGGGAAFEIGSRRYYPLCIGEKGVFRFLVRAHGTAGHASVPAIGDNALLKLAPVLERLRTQPPIEPTPEAIEFLSAVIHRDLGASPEALPEAVEELRRSAPDVVAYLVEPILRVTLVPTTARASRKANVIPSVAEILVDCRVPPGMGEKDVRERALAVLGDSVEAPDLEIEFVEHVVGNRSPAQSSFAGAIGSWLADADPGAVLVPTAFPGFSDCHWFREAFDSALVYGFCPKREMSLPKAAPLIHAPDERAATSDIEFATRFFRDIVRDVLG